MLHPRRVTKGVVAGVRDYGNRMGIPTVNGAIYFDPRYLGNPLVFCGNVGLIPADKIEKRMRPGDLIVAVGGRTGRDGIHGATFQFGRADAARAKRFPAARCRSATPSPKRCWSTCCWRPATAASIHAVTDCGAGGFSSAVGEMGEETGPRSGSTGRR